MIEKMTTRIRVWSTRNLSYMARVQLVNSVLLSLHSYWAQVFILLKKVLDEINKICRAFVWSGQQFSHKNGSVSWEQMCSSKAAGRMGFRNIIHWNKASLGKYVWALETKQDSVLIKLISLVYLKNTEWWNYTPQAGASWYWKKIC